MLSTSMTRSLRAHTASLLLAVAAAVGLVTNADAQTRWFTVEVIIFSQLTEENLAAEYWDSSPEPPSLVGAVQPGRAGAGNPQAGGTIAYRLLPRESFTMIDIARRVGGGGRRVGLHIAWRQPGLSRQEARPLRIRSGQFGGAAIDGTLKVWLGRYLHVDADLELESGERWSTLGLEPLRPVPVATALEEPALAGQPSAFGTPVAALRSPELARFRLTQSRRMRSGEIHYIDHPAMGVIVKIERFGS